MKRTGAIVYLEADLEACAGRLGEQETSIRPLWKDKQGLTSLFNKRQPLYAQAGLTICTNNMNADETADRRLRRSPHNPGTVA